MTARPDGSSAYRTTHDRILGSAAPTDDRWALHLALGVRPYLLEGIGALADAAHPSDTAARDELTGWLVSLATGFPLTDGRLSEPDLLGWLALAAAAPADHEPAAVEALTRLVEGDDLAAWLEPLPGQDSTVTWAPRCWAAGLSPAEARDRAAVGTLDDADLRTLAALRGFRPPLVDGT